MNGIAQQNLILNNYGDEAEIKASGSITLKDGFYIPSGKTVRIYTQANFNNCVTFRGVPSTNQNYISTKTFKVAGVNANNIDSVRSICEVNQTIQYFDGLGRPLQNITVQGSPTFRDLVQPIVYDIFGREEKKYLPFTAPLSNSTGAYKSASIEDQSSFYSNPGNANWLSPGVIQIPEIAYSETKFEASPLNRILEKAGPGLSWGISNGHTQKIEYGVNTIKDSVKLWSVKTNPAGAISIFYQPGSLYKTITKDENWLIGKPGTVEEFKDFQDHIVLKRVWKDEEISLSTYYIYDEIGNLRYVLPPAVNKNTDRTSIPLDSFNETDVLFNHFIYGYYYDDRDRVVKKKLPGKGWELLVYNNLDQIVLKQNANQGKSGKWQYTKYDGVGRVISTGLYNNPLTSISEMQTLVSQDGQSNRIWETRNAGSGYTNNSFPRDNISPQVVNYYDNYYFPGNVFGLPIGSQATGGRVKGLLTGVKVNILGTTDTLLTVDYYDEETRVVQTKSQNHLGGTDIIDNRYSFAGDLLESKRVNTVEGVSTTISKRYEYDHVGRSKAIMESINSGAEVVLRKDDYNELGQLMKRSKHSTDGAPFLQENDYRYNERGWLKSNTSQQFSFKLGYDTLNRPQYNGNISSQEWGWGTTYTNKYLYSYDRLNRVLSGVSTGVDMSELINYDVMGNISNLNRNGLGNSIYSYDGNQLKEIKGGTMSTQNYNYDSNGNVKVDGRNGTNIIYNDLDLPEAITKQGLTISYLYDAAGRKLRKISNGTIRNYIDGIEYNGAKIDIIHTEEGVARNNSGIYSYEYNLTDHLGNVRYTFYKNPISLKLEMLQKDDYYVFGKRYEISGTNKYLYNGKELQEELGQFDYGARFYDAEIGRWNAIDPLSEKAELISPYSYVNNNPISNTDPDGRETYYGNEAKAIFDQMQAHAASKIKGPRDDWWKDLLALLGLGPKNQPKNAQEASEQSEAQEPFISTGKRAQNLEDGISKIPFLGGTYLMMKGGSGSFANRANYATIALGMASVGLDVVGAVEIVGAFKSLSQLGLKDGMKRSANEVLELAQEYLGKGYKEVVPGSGRYISADGKRVFRMGTSDITGAHGGGPHVNFETLIPNPAKPGKMMVDKNIHIYLL
jgi:RHS repeat-associated protein